MCPGSAATVSAKALSNERSKVGDRELFAHLWSGDDGWSIQTEQERFAPKLAEGLPELSLHAEKHRELICIKRGESGYYKSDWNTDSAEKNQELADYNNERLGVTDAQRRTMECGSMHGWNVPGADPSAYRAERTADGRDDPWIRSWPSTLPRPTRLKARRMRCSRCLLCPMSCSTRWNRARVQQGDDLYFQVEKYSVFEYMEPPFITDANNLVELNTLCQKLSELNDQQARLLRDSSNWRLPKKTAPSPSGSSSTLPAAPVLPCGGRGSERLSAQRVYAENGFVRARIISRTGV